MTTRLLVTIYILYVTDDSPNWLHGRQKVLLPQISWKSSLRKTKKKIVNLTIQCSNMLMFSMWISKKRGLSFYFTVPGKNIKVHRTCICGSFSNTLNLSNQLQMRHLINVLRFKLKIYFRKFYGQYNNLVQHYNTPLSQFLCGLVLC